MKLTSGITPFIIVLAITILIRQLYMSKYHHGKSFYHTWTGRSHYCAKCGSKDCKCPKKEGYTTGGCGCGA